MQGIDEEWLKTKVSQMLSLCGCFVNSGRALIIAVSAVFGGADEAGGAAPDCIPRTTSWCGGR